VAGAVAWRGELDSRPFAQCAAVGARARPARQRMVFGAACAVPAAAFSVVMRGRPSRVESGPATSEGRWYLAQQSFCGRERLSHGMRTQTDQALGMRDQWRRRVREREGAVDRRSVRRDDVESSGDRRLTQHNGHCVSRGKQRSDSVRTPPDRDPALMASGSAASSQPSSAAFTPGEQIPAGAVVRMR
jgi:hypothetical protein